MKSDRSERQALAALVLAALAVAGMVFIAVYSVLGGRW